MLKELSIEEKAKAYDEALEKVKIWQKHLYDVNDKDYADELNYIFPELKESKDEKVKNKLIEFFKGYFPDEEWWGNITQEDILAWLEKHSQVEEFSISQHENKTCKENDDSLTSENERIRKEIIDFVKSKGGFKGDWITWLEKQGEQKLAWSEEDKEVWAMVISLVERQDNISPTIPLHEDRIKMLDWLKSLRPQSLWKPSEMQMTALRRVKNAVGGEGEIYEPLNSLYEDLKKLKG